MVVSVQSDWTYPQTICTCGNILRNPWTHSRNPISETLMATAIQWIAMVVAMLYLFVQYRKAKNTAWRRRRAIRHHQVLKDIGCFKWVPLRLYSKVPSGKYLCGRNKQQMAFKKIVAVKRDPPLNRIMKQMKPVKISRENRILPPKDVKLLTIYL
ncbi:hypothetical protein T02_7849 [Trichinella nativa]|uniref:Uncharacterized protein n=1 Tax=Trichinella nativa TaxID=6335 RepID=A0A0V1KVM4_9BILA|nr:hypothetical protein T02_7849 [Trichinella nativa]